jgi:sec-independent protein translocase protein TatB
MTFSETIFLFFLALIVFGPKKLPEIARQIGKALNEFRRASNEFKAQIEQEISNLEVEKHQTILPPSPTPDGVASRTLSAEPAATLAATAPATTDEPAGAVTEPPPVATEAVAPVDPSAVADAHDTPAPVSPSNEVMPPASQESHV